MKAPNMQAICDFSNHGIYLLGKCRGIIFLFWYLTKQIPKKNQRYIRNFSSLAQSKTTHSMFFSGCLLLLIEIAAGNTKPNFDFFPMAASDLFQARKLGEDGTHS